jgi:hypothetical protein
MSWRCVCTSSRVRCRHTFVHCTCLNRSVRSGLGPGRDQLGPKRDTLGNRPNPLTTQKASGSSPWANGIPSRHFRARVFDVVGWISGSCRDRLTTAGLLLYFSVDAFIHFTWFNAGALDVLATMRLEEHRFSVQSHRFSLPNSRFYY